MFWNGTDWTVAVREEEKEKDVCVTRDTLPYPARGSTNFNPFKSTSSPNTEFLLLQKLISISPLNVEPERCVQVALVPLALVRINFGKRCMTADKYRSGHGNRKFNPRSCSYDCHDLPRLQARA